MYLSAVRASNLHVPLHAGEVVGNVAPLLPRAKVGTRTLGAKPYVLDGFARVGSRRLILSRTCATPTTMSSLSGEQGKKLHVALSSGKPPAWQAYNYRSGFGGPYFYQETMWMKKSILQRLQNMAPFVNEKMSRLTCQPEYPADISKSLALCLGTYQLESRDLRLFSHPSLLNIRTGTNRIAETHTREHVLIETTDWRRLKDLAPWINDNVPGGSVTVTTPTLMSIALELGTEELEASWRPPTRLFI